MDESVVIDCPECNSTATYSDNGINCSNTDCPNSK